MTLQKIGDSKKLKNSWNKNHCVFELNKAGLIFTDATDLLNKIFNEADLQINQDFFIYKNGIHLDPNFLPASKSKIHPVDTNVNQHLLKKIFKEAASLKIEQVQRFDTTLSNWCEQFQNTFDLPVSMNLYFTPPWSKCFVKHVDPYHIFIAQIGGEKLWQIDPVTENFKETREKEEDLKNSQFPEFNVRLKAGDLLYLPLNSPHYAYTTGHSSIHLTIGLHEISVHEYLMKLLGNNESEFVQTLRKIKVKSSHPFYKSSQIEQKTIDSLVEDFRKELTNLKDKGFPKSFKQKQLSYHANRIDLNHIRSLYPDSCLKVLKKGSKEISKMMAKFEAEEKNSAVLKKLLLKDQFYLGEIIESDLKMNWQKLYLIFQNEITEGNIVVVSSSFHKTLDPEFIEACRQLNIFMYRPWKSPVSIMHLGKEIKRIQLNGEQMKRFWIEKSRDKMFLSKLYRKFKDDSFIY